MTLGRTSTGAIKIKTDSPGLRAVECACCGGTCPCPLPTEIKGKKIAVTAVSWSSILEYGIMDACGIFYANVASGHSIYFQYLCPVNPYDWPWIGSIYNGGPTGDGNPCNLLSTFISNTNPIGTHPVIDDYGPGGSGCDDWTLTISEVP